MGRGSGRFVVLVGPDGVGKTTVADALADAWGGGSAYFHFIPEVLGRLPTRPPVHGAPRPPSRAEGSVAIGWLRLARNLVRCWAAYLGAVVPACRRGILVVGDRWIYGYVAQPRPLRFYGPPRVAATALRLAPRPDLVANLAAPPSVVRARKQELSEAEVEAELQAWRRVPHCRLRTFDATEPPATIAARILEAL